MFHYTKLSTFIKRLEAIQEKHGDINMCGTIKLKVYAPKTKPEVGMDILLPPKFKN
jgi:hypothetical protein